MSLEKTRTQLKSKLQSAYDDAIALFSSLSTEQLALTIETDEKWAVADELRHLVSAEGGMRFHIKNISAGETKGADDSFDLHYFNKRQIEKMQAMDIPALLEVFGKSHQKTMAILDGVSAEQLTAEGRHPWDKIGVISVEQWFNLIADHKRFHLKEIKAILAT